MACHEKWWNDLWSTPEVFSVSSFAIGITQQTTTQPPFNIFSQEFPRWLFDTYGQRSVLIVRLIWIIHPSYKSLVDSIIAYSLQVCAPNRKSMRQTTSLTFWGFIDFEPLLPRFCFAEAWNRQYSAQIISSDEQWAWKNKDSKKST